MDECRAGYRRWHTAPVGEHYLSILSHAGESVPDECGVGDQTLGDIVDPLRSGSGMEVVNTVTAMTGIDAADWGWPRVVAFVAGLEGGAG
jgi:hypothetical protein